VWDSHKTGSDKPRATQLEAGARLPILSNNDATSFSILSFS